ncbi:MAG: hypothetical protein GF401_11760 [Chitinivibrionales bacterium]|nr:hypothetical protein [Chitinivibrionales bacterium]
MIPFISTCIFLFSLFAFAAEPVDVQFDIAAKKPVLNPSRLTGTCLPIWNSNHLYEEIKHGMETARFSLFRFPNGSMSNDYHWNGSGEYDSIGVWISDTGEYTPGFVVHTKHRGTSKYHYGFEGSSHITDGDTATMWWSDPYVTQTSPWFYLQLDKSYEIDSIVVVWGERHGVDFAIDVWSGTGTFYPGPHQTNGNMWKTVKEVTGNTDTVFACSLDTGRRTSYLRIQSSLSASGAKDIQVREVYLYSGGEQISNNIKSYRKESGDQTKVIALSAHPANIMREDFAGGWVDWDFESFMDYVESFEYGAIPVICVNYSTGTPQEAARWVRYANKVKDYDIRYWQVGNEMDGDWEEGGPVTAAMYAEKFIAFSKAMKAVDPTIKVFGPVLAGADFNRQASGDFNLKSWMHTFLEYVGAIEKTDGVSYCDGVDFHCYPYWFSSRPNESSMLEKSDYVYEKSDTLLDMIDAYLLQPESTLVFMSEYNMSVQMAGILMEPVNTVCLANMFGGFVEKFGYRGMTVIWDSYEGGGSGPDGTHGSLSLFNPVGETVYSSFTHAPSAAWWSSYMSNALWIGSDFGQAPVLGNYERNSGLRAYGIHTADQFRTLLCNTGNDTLAVTISIEGTNYTSADWYQWNEELFSWNGIDKRAYAAPNCGPVSRRISLDSIQAVMLPPVSVAVVAYHNGISSDTKPDIVHLGSEPGRLRSGDSLKVWGTATGNSSVVTRIGYSVDSKDSFSALVSVDGGFDGPSESFMFALAPDLFAKGEHVLYVQAMTESGESTIDSLPFSVSGRLRPVLLIDNFQDSNLVSSLPDAARWRSYAHGKNESSIALSIDRRSGDNLSLRADFTVVQPADLGYSNFAKLNLPLDTLFMDTMQPTITGMRFDYASSHSGGAESFFLHVNSTKVTDYDEFNMPLDNTGGMWKTMTFAWQDLSQYGWGEAVASIGPGDIYDLEFRAVGEGDGFLAIDNVVFLSDSGDSIIMPLKANGVLHRRQGLFHRRFPNGALEFTWINTDNARPRIEIFDMLGTCIHNSGKLEPGQARYVWDKKNGLASGMYACRITLGNKHTTLLLLHGGAR